MFVLKRNGMKEAIDLEKIHKVISWAAKGLTGVSVSQVELKAKIGFAEGMTTYKIHETLIKSAADLISEENPDYQYLAARLSVFHIRKRVFKSIHPVNLFKHITKLTVDGWYDTAILENYSKEEIEKFDQYIDHDRDFTFSYCAIKQLEGKYLLQNRTTKEIKETPQISYILIAMCLFSNYDKKNRSDYVKKFYDAISTFRLSLPTPIMAGVRTLTRQYSSCVLIEAADSLDSINAAASSIVKYVSQKAGIGINPGMIRAVGSPIRNGETEHTGCIPFFKYFQTAVKSCSQGGVRGGAATLFYPIWHLEVQDLLVLKNNKGVENNRVRHLDYGVQFSRFFYKRVIAGENISLFSPSDVPGLYEAFFADQEEFERLYTKYENDTNIRKEVVPSIELFSLFTSERANTGRIYLQNVDHSNTHSAFNPKKAPIRQSNLCMEITLPTKPLENILDEKGEIALCTLAAFNLGKIEKLEDFKELADLLVRALDNLLTYQNYPIPAAKHSSDNRRTLGIGVINYAYYLAKNSYRYSDGSANKITHETFEAMQYYLLKASCQLAKEQGKCNYFDDTSYADGLLPIDTYKKDIDKFANFKLLQDWETLRKDIKKYGLRNSTLSALMPSETSSQISNATNGIEPPRGFISVKASKDGILKQVVPEYQTLKNKYELLWTIPNNEGILQLNAIMQKFIDQAISTNLNYNPKFFPDEKIPMSIMQRDIIKAYTYGIKTLYYHNTNDGSGEDNVVSKRDDDCGDSCKI